MLSHKFYKTIKTIDEKYFFKILKKLKFFLTRIKFYAYFTLERLLLIHAIYWKRKINFQFLNGDQFNKVRKQRSKEMLLLLKKQILKSDKKKTFKLLEIGSYLGQSTELLGNCLKENCKDFLIISIDPYKSYASPDEQKTNSVVYRASKKIHKIYYYFLHNISLQSWRNNFIHIRKDSKDGLLLLRSLKLSFDFIYIDGSHYYEVVKNDFLQGKKLLKKDTNYQGTLCGDDYEFDGRNYKKFNLTKNEFAIFLNKNKHVDCTSLRTPKKNGGGAGGGSISFHPGITKLFLEVKDTIKKSNSGFWTLKN
jgi:hypothetical protein